MFGEARQGRLRLAASNSGVERKNLAPDIEFVVRPSLARHHEAA